MMMLSGIVSQPEGWYKICVIVDEKTLSGAKAKEVLRRVCLRASVIKERPRMVRPHRMDEYDGDMKMGEFTINKTEGF